MLQLMRAWENREKRRNKKHASWAESIELI